MEDTKRTKNFIMGMLCLVICMMSVAYAMLANDAITKVEETESKRGPYWNVGILDITEESKTGSAYSKTPPFNTTTYATFHAHFVQPGDSITYKVTIKNAGWLDARLASINYITDYNPNITYELIGIKVGDKLKVGASKEVYIRITFNKNSTNIIKTYRDLTIFFYYVQDI